MKRHPLKCVIVAIALLMAGLTVQPADAGPSKRSTKKISGTVSSAIAKKAKSKKSKSSKRKKAKGKNGNGKQKAMTVLREYLPYLADVHEAKAGASDLRLIPVRSDFDTRSPFRHPQLRYDLVVNISSWLGTRYRYGGSSKRGVDCSGFTSAVVSNTLRTAFNGSSRVQAARFVPIFDTDSLQFGDMVFFTGRNKRSTRIGHVGIFLGNGVFAHSSTGRGVIYTHLSEGYYTERFRWGGRFVDANVLQAHAGEGSL